MGARRRPVLSALNLPDTQDWGPKHKSALRSLVMGRQWPQQRLHRAGLCETDSCQLCEGLPGGPHQGTLWHRLECTATSEARAAMMPEAVVAAIRAAGAQVPATLHHCLTTALTPAPRPPVRPGSVFETFRWDHPAEDALPGELRVFTDGSLLDGQWKGFEALGWAFVALGPDGRVVAEASGGSTGYGPVPGSGASVRARPGARRRSASSELCALLPPSGEILVGYCP